MENKQTSTEWLESEFIKLEQTIGVHGIMYELIEQAKAMENKTDIQQLIDRNYAAQIKRGQITMEKTLNDFLQKIDEEVKEFKNSYTNDGYFEDIDDKELIDIMLVCFSMAKHFGIDWQKVMTDKVEFNEKRKD
jgi:NTP pyrophosphatase (non-canonical NTP hydrolase)